MSLFCNSISLCVNAEWKQYHQSLRKQNSHGRHRGEGRHKEHSLKKIRKEASYEHFWHSSAPCSSRIFFRGSSPSSKEPSAQDPAGSSALFLLTAATVKLLRVENRRKSTLKQEFQSLTLFNLTQVNMREKETLLPWKVLPTLPLYRMLAFPVQRSCQIFMEVWPKRALFPPSVILRFCKQVC